MANKLDREVRLTFLGIDDDTRAALKGFTPVLEAALPKLLERFYAHLAAIDTRAMLSGVPIDHLKSAQSRHWTSLFAGTFDEALLERTVAIGTTHQRIGRSRAGISAAMPLR